MDINFKLYSLCSENNKEQQTKQEIINIIKEKSDKLYLNYTYFHLSPLTALIRSDGDNDELIKFLLNNEYFNYSSLIHKHDKLGLDALTHAISTGKLSIVKLLTSSNEIPTHALFENKNCSAFKVAINNNQPEILEYLVNQPCYKDINFNSEKNARLFLNSIKQGHFEVLEYALNGKKPQEHFSFSKIVDKVNFIFEIFQTENINILNYLIQIPLFTDEFIHRYKITLITRMNTIVEPHKLVDFLVFKCDLSLNDVEKNKLIKRISNNNYQYMLKSIEQRDEYKENYKLLNEILPIKPEKQKTIKI